MTKTFLEKCSRAFDSLLSLTAAINGALVVFLMISVCYDVVARYFFNRPTSWVAEVGAFILLILPFLATGWVLKNNTHIRMDLLYERFTVRRRAILDALTSFLSVIVCLIIVWRGTGVVLELFKFRTHTDTSMLVVQWPFMAVIPFGILLFLLEYFRRFLRSITLLAGKEGDKPPKLNEN